MMDERRATQMKRIGVLTSGGDAPGMNAAIRAVVRVAYEHEMEVFGIKRGYQGFLEGKADLLSRADVSGISLDGGTILGTMRCKEFEDKANRKAAIDRIKQAYGLEGLVVIGGDGTFQGAQALSNEGMPTVGVPGTIDNDLAYTDFTIGFDTAVNTVVQSVSKIRDTVESHGRIGVIEVMGRRCGDIALFSGVASGAERILIPEFAWDMNEIAQSLLRRRQLGMEAAIIIVAEGVGTAESIVSPLRELTKLDIRATVLGHVQRGGSPTTTDATLAARLGGQAVELLSKGQKNCVVGIVNNHVRTFDIDDALKAKRPLHTKLYKLAHTLSV
jgi:6-phosphofructokinase 1